MRLSFLIFILSIFSLNSWAQDKCTKDQPFSKIPYDCIVGAAKKFDAVAEEQKGIATRIENLKNDKAVEGARIRKGEFLYKLLVNMSDEEEAKKSLNNTFFFKTKNGLMGKFVVRSTIVSLEECSLYAEAYVYTDQGIKNVSTNFVIKNEANSWNSDTGSFEGSSSSDFVLKREFGRCALKMDEGLAFNFGKTKEVEEITGDPLLLYTSYFLFGLAVFLIMQTFFKDEDRFKAELRLDEADEDEKKKLPNDVVLKYSQPFFKRYVSPVVKGMKYKKKIREKYKRKLASSGMNKFLSPEDFFAFKLFLIIGFPVVYIFGGKFMEVEVELSYVPFLVVGGFFYPDLWIKEKIKARQEEIMLNMPFVVDMLALSVEAGLDFVSAIQKVIEKAPPSALVDEFEIFLKETRVGASRAEGLRALSWRIDMLPIASFCATLIAADSVGSSNLAPILKTLSDEMRQKRSTDVEKKGAQASTKMLFPMMFLILPAVILIIAAPFVIGFMEG